MCAILACTTEAGATGVGKIKAVALQLLEELGVTSGGVYTPAASTLQQVTDVGATTTTKSTFSGGVVASEVVLDATNKDAFITPTATAGEFTFGSTSGAKDSTLHFNNWTTDPTGATTTTNIVGTGARWRILFSSGDMVALNGFGPNTGLYLGNARVLGWTSNAANGVASNLCISRLADGELAIGTVAAGATDATLNVDGLVLGYVAKTAAYTATRTDHTIACDATTAAFTVTLPPAASNAGLILIVKKTDASANAITIDGDAAEAIDGAATQTLATQWSSLTIQCDGTGWLIL